MTCGFGICEAPATWRVIDKRAVTRHSCNDHLSNCLTREKATHRWPVTVEPIW